MGGDLASTCRRGCKIGRNSRRGFVTLFRREKVVETLVLAFRTVVYGYD